MCHVLIIEDEPLIAMDLEHLLEREGVCSFSFAASQEEAVSAARAQRPDLITSDVTLIEGTGPAAIAAIRATLGPIPVVFITATPGACCAEDQLTRALGKPLNRPVIASVFRELREASRC